MADAELRAVLASISKSRKLPCDDGTELEIWRDFDSEETRMRPAPSAPVIRVDEARLGDFINAEKIAVSEETISRLLIDICRRPDKYGALVISTS
jgi:hypothetical protein